MTSSQATATLQEEIRRFARSCNVGILAHHSTAAEIQAVADITGDSLELASHAQRTGAAAFLVCGMRFMAESVKALNYDRVVIYPAGVGACALADAINVRRLGDWKTQNPGAVVVSTPETSAAVKAESDFCVTADTAAAVLLSIPADRTVLFLPDMFLGAWMRQLLGLENLRIWRGECGVYGGIEETSVNALRRTMAGAEVLIHAGCSCATRLAWSDGETLLPHERTQVLSTAGMIEFAQATDADTLIVAAEPGVVERLRREAPDKAIIAADESVACGPLRQISLAMVRDALFEMQPEVWLDAQVASAAARAIERGLAFAG